MQKLGELNTAVTRAKMERLQKEAVERQLSAIESDEAAVATFPVVLGNAFNINSGVVVDTHVARLSQRLGLSKEKAAEKIEQDLMRLVPQKEWALFSHLLIWHGRRRCYARNPDCANCEVKDLCPSAFRVSKIASEKQ